MSDRDRRELERRALAGDQDALLKALLVRDRDRVDAAMSSTADNPPTKLVCFEEASYTQRQHVGPCPDCPFLRDAIPGWLGMEETPESWMQLAHGEGTADCHALKGERRVWACAGLAIYRANVCKRPRDPHALILDPDRKRVFASPREFIDHHSNGG